MVVVLLRLLARHSHFAQARHLPASGSLASCEMNSAFLFSSAFVAVLCYRRWLNKTRRALKQQKGNTQTRQSIAGVLTGISYVSGIDYYKGINELVRSRIPKGHLFSPNPMMVMISVDCDQYAYNLINKNWSGVQKYLLTGSRVSAWTTLYARPNSNHTYQSGVDKLVKAGIDFLVIASNTGHIGVPAIRHRYPDLPILHIADCTARAITAQGIKCVGLLGTEPTMRERFLIARLEQHGLRVLVPDSEQDMSRIFRWYVGL